MRVAGDKVRLLEEVKWMVDTLSLAEGKRVVLEDELGRGCWGIVGILWREERVVREGTWHWELKEFVVEMALVGLLLAVEGLASIVLRAAMGKLPGCWNFSVVLQCTRSSCYLLSWHKYFRKRRCYSPSPWAARQVK